MNTIQYAIITTLGIATCASILFFDGRGKSHRPAASFAAWLMFILTGALVGAAMMQQERIVVWLLIFIFALNVGAVLMARGNVNKLATHLKNPESPQAPPAKTKPHIRRHPHGHRRA